MNFLVLDAVCSQIPLGRRLFEVGVERGFYAKVSRLGEQWFELDLHFLSLGGGEIALGWWFEECLVPYLSDTDKLNSVKSMSIVTGYGKTRTRGRRNGDDGMRKRCRAMLRFMGITEQEQPNLGRIHIDKDSLIELVKKNGGMIIFDLDGYLQWKEEETRANAPPDVEQKIRARFKPTVAGSGGPPFTRVESEYTSDEYRLENHEARMAKLRAQDLLNESDLSGDAEYAANDSDKFRRRPEDSLGRVGTGRHIVGRGFAGEEREFNRVDSFKRGTENGDARVYDTDAAHIDRGRSFHHDNTNIPHHRNNSHGHYNRENDRESSAGFQRNTQSINRYHQQYGEDTESNENGTRRFDHIYENQGASVFQRVDGDFGNVQSHHAAGSNVNLHRQRIDEYGEQAMVSRDVGMENRGIEQKHYQKDQASFMETRQQPRVDFRSNSLDRDFQGPRENWRQSEHTNNPHAQILGMGHNNEGRADERNSFLYDHESAYRDTGNPINHRIPDSSSNYQGDGSMQHYRDESLRFEQEAIRKRQHTEAPSQVARIVDTQGDRLPIANNGRGYALEPETQRRRLS